MQLCIYLKYLYLTNHYVTPCTEALRQGKGALALEASAPLHLCCQGTCNMVDRAAE